MQAKYWHSENDIVICDLCPRSCVIGAGEYGYCKIRRNDGGQLHTEISGNFSSLAVDPVEKKPLYHFLPGSRILSFGTIGCNLGCRFCQNWEISQTGDKGLITRRLEPAQWPELCRAKGCQSLAFTYNEPLASFENTLAVAGACRNSGICTALVSAGYINSGPLAELAPSLDAANIDLKSFDDEFYKTYCDGALRPVLDSLLLLKKSGVLLEITTLLIPECNDDMARIRAMCTWIVAELGKETPLHFSAYHPAHRLSKPNTSFETLYAAWQIARECGLDYVYLGNIVNTRYNSTYCAHCGEMMVERCGYNVRLRTVDGSCPRCGAGFSGIWR